MCRALDHSARGDSWKRSVARCADPAVAAVRGALLPVLLWTGACASPHPEAAYRFTRFAMDTVVEYTIVADSPTRAREAMLAAHSEVERVANLLWEDNPQSEIHAALQRAEPVGPETFSFLKRAYGYYELSEGAFDPTIKGVLDLYSFGAEKPVTPSVPAVEDALKTVGMKGIRLIETTNRIESTSARTRLAVGGIAKGYAVDRAISVLREHGITNALVNAGGDLYASGRRSGEPWKVGIRDPRNPNGLLTALEISDRAVATSGDYERFFIADGERYHHIIDPATGRPASGARSVTVVARTAEEADALATAFFVMGPARALSVAKRLEGVETLIADAQGRLHASSNLP